MRCSILGFFALGAVTLAFSGCGDDAGQRCVPRADSDLCASAGRMCGTASVTDCDGARVVQCGACTDGWLCQDDGQCVDPACVPESDDALCAADGLSCGTHTLTDRCGATRGVPCGACDPSKTCSVDGQCIDPACVPETEADLCVAAARECGSHTRTDRCEQVRTLACGECTGTLTCSADGHCVPPTCVAETDAAFCARLAASCGTQTGTDNCGNPRTATCGAACPPPTGDAGWYGEFEVDDPIYTAAYDTSRLLTIRTGAHYLSVWQDGRSDGSGWSVSDAIMVTRVTDAGAVLDPGGRMLAEPGSALSIAGLVFDGSEAVLALSEYGGDDEQILWLLRLDTDGRPLADRVEVVRGNLHGFQIAFAGDRLVLAWFEETADASRLVVQAAMPGTLALGDVHAVSTVGHYPSALSMATHAGLTMLAWVDWDPAGTHTLRTTTLGNDDAPTTPGGTELPDALGPLVVNSYLQVHTLVQTPTGFAMLHSHHDAQASLRRLHASFFADTGAAIAGAPLLLAERAATVGEYAADADVLGADVLVVYATGASDHAGLVLDSGARAITAGPSALAQTPYGGGDFACHATECTYGYQNGFPSETQLIRYGADFALRGTATPATSAEEQLAPAVAFDGTQYLVVWRTHPVSDWHNDDKSHRLLLRRFGRDGAARDAAPIEVPLTDKISYSFGAAAYPSGGFLVRWIEQDPSFDDRVYLRRLRADGTWAWPAAVRLDVFTSYGFQFGASACAGEHCLVSLAETFKPMDHVVVDGTGAVVRGRSQVAGLTDDRVTPALRYDGADLFWLVFADTDALHVRTVQATGAAIGLAGAATFDVPAVADVRRTGAAWQARGSEMLAVVGVTVVDAGTTSGFRNFVEARVLTPGTGSGGTGLSAPFTIVDNVPYPAQWIGAAATADVLESYFIGYGGTREQLMRARHHRTNGITDTLTAVFAETWLANPSLTADGARALLAYTRIDWDVGFGGERVRLQFVGNRDGLLSDDAVCASDGQCASGRCRSGQCCDECGLWKGL